MSQLPATVGKSKSGISRANSNKAIRQKALREQLAAQGHVQHINDIAEKLGNLEDDLDPVEITRLVKTAEIKLKLVNKYLPDLKAIEHSGEVKQEHKPITPEDLEILHRLREAKNADG